MLRIIMYIRIFLHLFLFPYFPNNENKLIFYFNNKNLSTIVNYKLITKEIINFRLKIEKLLTSLRISLLSMFNMNSCMIPNFYATENEIFETFLLLNKF